MQRFRLLLPLLILFCALIGCKWSSESNSNSTTPISAATPQTSALENEAVAEVKELWDEHTTKCGDSYFSSEDFRGIITIHEYKNVSFVPRRTGPTTEADKLNGILWNGVVQIRTGQYRDNHEGQWYPWKQEQSGGEEVGATKRESGWSVVQILHITDLRKIKCSEVPT